MSLSSPENEILNALKSKTHLFLQRLLERGLNPNHRLSSHDDHSLLHFAVGLQKPDIIILLLLKGADPNIRSHDYLTPLHLSALWDFPDSLKCLLKHGGNPYLCDLSGKTVFDIIEEESSERCRFVLQEWMSFEKSLTRSPAGQAGLPKTSTGRMSTILFPDSTLTSYIEDSEEVSLNRAFLTIPSPSEAEASHNELNPHYSLLSEGSINGLPVVEYLYSDPVERISLVETRYPGSRSIKPSFSSNSLKTICSFKSISSYKSISSALSRKVQKSETQCSSSSKVNKSSSDTSENSWYSAVSDWNCAFLIPDHLNKLSNSDIRQELINLGQEPGPITRDTRTVYLKWLARLRAVSPETNKAWRSNSCLTNSELYEELKRLGENPGPVTDENRKIYLRILQKLSTGGSISEDLNSGFLTGYPDELRSLSDLHDNIWIEEFLTMERELNSDFDQPTAVWREGNHKTAFSYLLLDPRITQNLPIRSLNPIEQLETFVHAIFYVGKGSRSRPLSHLYDSVRAISAGSLMNCSQKVQRICDIWKEGYGVVSLYCFQNVIPAEAYTRESCMISALGLQNITNLKKGDCYGKASLWPLPKRRKFGAFLLYRALYVFLNEGERQLRPTDLNMK